MNIAQRTFLIAFMLVSDLANAQVPFCSNYHGDFCYGGLGAEDLMQAIATSDGNIVVVGSTNGELGGGNFDPTRYGGWSDAFVAKLTPGGTILWSKVFGGSRTDEFTGVVEMPGGAVLIVGSTSSTDGTAPPGGFGGLDGWELFIDPVGDVIWNDRFDSPDLSHSYGGMSRKNDRAMVIDYDTHGEFPSSGFTIDTDGSIQASNPNFSGLAVATGADGSFLMMNDFYAGIGGSTGVYAGTAAPLDGGSDFGVKNVNDDGTINWVKRFVTRTGDTPGSILALSDGYLLLASSSGSTTGGDHLSANHGGLDIWAIRIDLDGNIIWERSYGGSGNEFSSAASLDTDGNILIAGGTTSPPSGDVTEADRGGTDGWVIKVAATSGAPIWNKRFGGSGRDHFNACIPVPSGYVLVGTSDSPRSGDHHQTGIGPTGSRDLWMVQMYPGTPTHWYYDADGDGFGKNPFFPVDDCVQPAFYVDNNWDCDDLVPNLPDEFLGAPCNDGDWHTMADALGSGCVCAGIFVDPDDLTPLTFTLWPDFDPGETTWELRDLSTQQIALQGGPYPNGQQGVPETATVMIPPTCNQRFQLAVFDGQGNGMPGGRYTLTAGTQRLIDSDGSFQQVSSVNSTLNSVDVPVGNIGLTQYTCDRLDLLPASVIVASEDQAVSMRFNLKEGDTGYQFWIFDPHGSYSRTIFKSHKNPGKGGAPGPTECAHLRLSSITTNPVPQNKLLNVRVRTRINGVDGPFGPACTMKIDPYAAACPTTKLIDSQNDPHYSCDQSYPLDGSTRMWAYAKLGVNKYQFEFRDQQGPYVRTIASATASLLMNTWATSPLQPLHVYSVRVRCSLDNGQTWCPWGSTCTIYTSGNGRSMVTEATDVDNAFLVYPNPVNSGEVYVQLLDPEAVEGTVDLMLMDVAGRSMLQKRMDAAVLGDQPTILPSSLVPGTYVLRLEHNGILQHQRLVVQ